MIYLIYGDEQYLIDRKVKELTANVDNSFLIRFDGDSKDFLLSDLIDSCNSNNLFGNKNVILFKNPSFFLSKTSDENIKTFIEYINDENPDCDLIIYSSFASFKSNLKIMKETISKAKTFVFTKMKDSNFYEYCNNELSSHRLLIDNNTRKYFIENCGCDLYLFYNGLENLISYDGNITKKVIDQLTSFSSDFGIFKLVNALIEGDISKTKFYMNLLDYKDENIFGLLSLVSSQLRFLYSVHYYSKKYNNINDIMDATNTDKSFRIEMALKTLRNIKASKILSILNKISDLDYDLKTNPNIDHNLLFDLFISTFNV